MKTMADKLGLGSEVRQVKLGQSFTNPKSVAFHTIRYDFKPASVDTNKLATVDVANNHQVTVTVPHLDGAGTPQTVFKGSQRPYQKECVLIIDRVTGQITLEKLGSNMQVKKTRSENHKPSGAPQPRPQTPPIAQRTSTKTRVTSGARRPERQITGLVPKHSPLHASPNYPSPGHHRSPKRDLVDPTASLGQSTLASLPLIGLDDSDMGAPSQPPPPPAPQPQLPPPPPTAPASSNGVGVLTDSSSSSSSDSDSDSEPDVPPPPSTAATSSGSQQHHHHHHHHRNGTPPKLPNQLLNEDLCLSESGSDSD